MRVYYFQGTKSECENELNMFRATWLVTDYSYETISEEKDIYIITIHYEER